MKRRLELMPEVLPAPNKVAASGPSVAGPSAVRARTMARLRALAAVVPEIAASGGAVETTQPDADRPRDVVPTPDSIGDADRR